EMEGQDQGIARSNAQVVIRQSGYVIYDSFVPPGAFEITDLYSTGSGGDLNVTVKEADGSEQHMVVPFASVPVLQREGQLQYSLTGGEYRSYNSEIEKTRFTQGTLIYGLPYGLTAYGGAQASSKYQSVSTGLGANMGALGAVSADVTQSFQSEKDDKKNRGQSWRARYSKSLSDYGTYFALAGYRYSTDGYRTLNEVLDTYSDSSSLGFNEHRRNRAELSVSQQLWEGAGSLSLSALREDYWGSDRSMNSVGVGYSNNWQKVSYNMNYRYNTNTYNTGSSKNNESIFSLNVGIPLGGFIKDTWANNSLTHDKRGTTQNIGLNGLALSDNSLSWGVQQGILSPDSSVSSSLYSTLRSTYAELNAGYSRYSDVQTMNYGISGGVLLHENGITLGQPLGETIALVKIPDAGGIKFNNQQGVSTDPRGYAILSYMSPYRENNITLNTETISDEIEIAKTNKSLVPTRGAVVRAEFDAKTGSRAMITLRQDNNSTVPFGAVVSLLNSPTSAGNIVGDGGEVYMGGLTPTGVLVAKWGSGLSQRCTMNYTIPANNPPSGIYSLSGICKR
uniref:fimbria/pilus outer membrane usher protein n=1 Tax=Enterobacter hormaechei TaxID=158836 RepID=UPI00114410CF